MQSSMQIVADNVCQRTGHKLARVVEDTRIMSVVRCTQCGMTLTEIRGEVRPEEAKCPAPVVGV